MRLNRKVGFGRLGLNMVNRLPMDSKKKLTMINHCQVNLRKI